MSRKLLTASKSYKIMCTTKCTQLNPKLIGSIFLRSVLAS